MTEGQPESLVQGILRAQREGSVRRKKEDFDRKMGELGAHVARGAELQGWAELAQDVATKKPESAFVRDVRDRLMLLESDSSETRDSAAKAFDENMRYREGLILAAADELGVDALVEKFGKGVLSNMLDTCIGECRRYIDETPGGLHVAQTLENLPKLIDIQQKIGV